MTIVPVNRRAFIKSSAAVTAGLVCSLPPSSAAPKPRR
nr:twin-arginine translocation signal domain-containing protein [Bradyrhizobium diazoefficiens]